MKLLHNLFEAPLQLIEAKDFELKAYYGLVKTIGRNLEGL